MKAYAQALLVAALFGTAWGVENGVRNGAASFFTVLGIGVLIIIFVRAIKNEQ